MIASFPQVRLRRLRQHQGIRNLVRETHLSMHDVILPLFIKVGKDVCHPISSMPGQNQYSTDQLPQVIKQIVKQGLQAVLLFGIVEEKDALGSAGYEKNGLIPTAIKIIKETAPELVVMTDVCLCDYTDHGHCGVVENERVLNDPTLELLAKMAVGHAKAGANVVAPSGMMDGMVISIRKALDNEGYVDTLILSYAAKYASGLYGPFREALESAPTFGDRCSHQMDPGNVNEAMREIELDIHEGADMVMVKPALAYLDVICRVKRAFPGVPLAAYQVSGEYAMIKAAAANGWIDEKRVAMESLLAIKRAGADMILTYFAQDLAEWLA